MYITVYREFMLRHLLPSFSSYIALTLTVSLGSQRREGHDWMSDDDLDDDQQNAPSIHSESI